MRSKEVEEAIDYLKELNPVQYWENPIREGLDKWVLKKDVKLQKVIDTALSYIETLEQLPNKIRDKIKELEEENEKKFKEVGCYYLGIIDKIKLLKEILGE